MRELKNNASNLSLIQTTCWIEQTELTVESHSRTNRVIYEKTSGKSKTDRNAHGSSVYPGDMHWFWILSVTLEPIRTKLELEGVSVLFWIHR